MDLYTQRESLLTFDIQNVFHSCYHGFPSHHHLYHQGLPVHHHARVQGWGGDGRPDLDEEEDRGGGEGGGGG